MKRISFDRLHQELTRVLLIHGLTGERAEQCARLFAQASLDGVASHGLNRFPRFIRYIKAGYVDVTASPKLIKQSVVMEQWDGQLGPGNLNAWFCMDRAMEIAEEKGLGLVALRNTNHWMRAGNYGWQAADKGFIGICFTNTQPNMPPWGAKEPLLGNNPLVIALPRREGHIVYDGAMSQFAFGKIDAYARQGKSLPVVGGYDSQGNITDDPAKIEASRRALPIGFWKGSSLALILDLLAASLSDGLSTQEIGKQSKDEYGLSQVFIAIRQSAIGNDIHYHQVVDQTIRALKQAAPADPNSPVYYPGEQTLLTR